ncbi:nicotinic acetylcholine receptor subunit beta3-like protein, partial [Leptotrombidium deliense]
MLKAQIEDIYISNDGNNETEKFWDYLGYILNLHSDDRAKYKEEIRALPTKEEKTKKLVEILTTSSGKQCDLSILEPALDRYALKSKLMYGHKTTTKFIGKVTLLRAKQKSLVYNFKDFEANDYGLSEAWNDEHLSWDPKSYGGLRRTFFDFTEIWKPDLILWNYGISLTRKDDFDKPVIRVNYKGVARAGINDIFEIRCPMDLTQFPYDTQRCDIWFTSVNYKGDLINITYFNKNNRCAYGPVFINQEYKVSNLSCKRYEFYGRANVYNGFQ